jgi:hypothetical protein
LLTNHVAAPQEEHVKVSPVLPAAVVAVGAAVALGVAPTAAAESGVQYLGQPGELVDGAVVQHWTVSGLKPSSDVIPYQPAGTLWEASATDEAVAGTVVPVVSNLNARAHNGDTYRVLFGVATPQGVNPAPLAQGEKTTGKIYFDVTGEKPDSVFYSSGGPEQLLWLQAPPPPAPVASGRTPYVTSPSTGASAEGATQSPAAAPAGPETPAGPTPATAAPAAAGSSGTPIPATAPGAAVPAGSSGTPLPAGSTGTPLPGSSGTAEAGPAPGGSSGTPLPQGAATIPGPAAAPAPVAAAPAPAPAAPAPAGSSGTPMQGPATTVVAPPPA